MSDHSLFVTFWTGAAIMFFAFCLAFYYSRSAFIRVIRGSTLQTEQSARQD